MLTIKNRILIFTVITIAACFFSGLIKSRNIEEADDDMNKTNSQISITVNASNPVQTQFIYGSKKKLISDF